MIISGYDEAPISRGEKVGHLFLILCLSPSFFVSFSQLVTTNHPDAQRQFRIAFVAD